MAIIPDDILPGRLYSVDCDKHKHTIGVLVPWGDRGAREWASFNPCPKCPCPAGGEHEWGTLEEAGTGKTWAGCENCGAAR